MAIHRICLALFVCAVIANPVSARADQKSLFAAIAERLGWMAPVAAWKHANKKPVEDLKREAVVLDAASADAASLGLAPDSVRGFFQAQIDAAKAIQWCWIKRWQSGAPEASDPPDLVDEIRPELIRLGRVVVENLASELSQAGPIGETAQAAFLESVSIDCLDDASRRALFEGLTKVRLAI